MMREKFSFTKILLVLLISTMSIGCQTMGPNTRAGGLGGGLAGTAIGAIAGASEGKPVEGALIGAAAGSLLGGALGNSVDREVANDQAYLNGIQQQALANSISINQVISMSQAGLDDQLIVNQINTNGVVNRLSTEELVLLKNNGVSNNVISAMQTARLATAPNYRSPVIVQQQPQVIVEERWVSPRGGYYYHRPYRHDHCPPAYRHHPHSGWGFSVDF